MLIPDNPLVTAESARAALESGGAACPRCGSREVNVLRGEEVTLDEDRAHYEPMRCEACNAWWTNVWEFARLLVYGQGDDPDTFAGPVAPPAASPVVTNSKEPDMTSPDTPPVAAAPAPAPRRSFFWDIGRVLGAGKVGDAPTPDDPLTIKELRIYIGADAPEIYLCRDDAAAQAVLDHYVRAHWAQEQQEGGLDGINLPDDRDDAIHLYFAHVNGEDFEVRDLAVLSADDVRSEPPVWPR